MKSYVSKNPFNESIEAGALYRECLLQHKQFIGNNRYARELELKYHRTVHKSLKPTPKLIIDNQEQGIHQ